MNTSGVGSGGATPQYSQCQLAVVANCRVGTVCFGGHVECRSKEGEKGNNSKDTLCRFKSPPAHSKWYFEVGSRGDGFDDDDCICM